ncbi:hypothetical protein PO909_011766 [Leuciscus waleckii]
MESARAERHCRIHKERLITSNSISSSRLGVSSTRPRLFKNPVPEKKERARERPLWSRSRMRHFYLSPRSIKIESEKGYFAGGKEALKGRKAEEEGSSPH